MTVSPPPDVCLRLRQIFYAWAPVPVKLLGTKGLFCRFSTVSMPTHTASHGKKDHPCPAEEKEEPKYVILIVPGAGGGVRIWTGSGRRGFVRPGRFLGRFRPFECYGNRPGLSG